MAYKIIMGIYCIENIINHKKYIGQSKNIKQRWHDHKKALNNNEHHNIHLQRAWNDYGEKAFNFYVVEECSFDELDEKENYYISLYNTMNKDFGYNLKKGGQNKSMELSEESRIKLSNAIKKSYTPELIEKRRKKALDYWSNPDNKQRIVGENNGMFGKKHSDEAKKKIGLASKGRKSARRLHIPVYCIELETEYKDAAEACEKLNIGNSTNIMQACQGKRHTCGGYHWKFIE